MINEKYLIIFIYTHFYFKRGLSGFEIYTQYAITHVCGVYIYRYIESMSFIQRGGGVGGREESGSESRIGKIK